MQPFAGTEDHLNYICKKDERFDISVFTSLKTSTNGDVPLDRCRESFDSFIYCFNEWLHTTYICLKGGLHEINTTCLTVRPFYDDWRITTETLQ